MTINKEDYHTQNISYLNQSSVLFPGSIKENIVFFEKKINIDEKKFSEVCNICKLDELLKDIEKNRKQDDHLYKNLSLGQIQRVCLARVLYSNKEIIILDEAISNVEKQMEKEITANLLNYLKKNKKTSVIATHSIDNYINADNISVMSNGKIILNGKHEELLKLNNFYIDNMN